MGATMQLPLDEKHGYTRDYVEGRLSILMGGRSAEMLIFNQMTTGAGNDIEQSTQIARKMVTEWGMSDLLGPMTFGNKSEEIFLGRDNLIGIIVKSRRG
jgi:cell division protease FtsH